LARLIDGIEYCLHLANVVAVDGYEIGPTSVLSKDASLANAGRVVEATRLERGCLASS
jgi:hypothetical protein